MNSLLLPDGVVLALMAALITYALHSTVLLGGAWVVERWLPAPRERDWLWKTAIVGSLLTTVVQLSAGLGPHVRASVAPASDQGFSYTQAPPAESGHQAAIGAPEGSIEPEQPTETTPTARDAARPYAAAPPSGATRLLWMVLAGALYLWLAGALLLGGRSLLVRWRFFHRLRDRRPVTQAEVWAALESLFDASNVRSTLRRNFRLTTSPILASPVAVGRSEICIPQRALTNLSVPQVRGMLAHEWAHLMRRDPRWLALFNALESLFFFQPLLRLARKRQQEAAEYLCDAWAVDHTGLRKALAQSLVEVAGWLRGGYVAFPMAGMALSPSSLTTRVERLFAGTVEVSPGTLWRARFAVAALALAVVAFSAPAVTLHRAERPLVPEVVTSTDSTAVQYTWRNETFKAQASLKGQITYNDAGDDVRGLAPGGYFELIDTSTPPRRRYRVAADTAGTLTRTFTVDGRAAPFDDDAQRWLAALLLKTGLSADERYLWKDGHAAYDALMRGHIVLNATADDVQQILPAGYFVIQRQEDGVETTFHIEATSPHRTVRTFTVGGDTRPMDDAARAWVAGVLTELARRGATFVLTGRSPLAGLGATVDASDGAYKNGSLSWFDAGEHVVCEYHGAIVLTRQKDAILYLSPKAHLHVEHEVEGAKHVLDVTPGADGVPVYRYQQNGRSQLFDEDARQWLATLLPELDRRAGFGH